jgi:epoxyqueuosine reductase QueG
MSHELKESLINRLKQVGAYDVRIANPHAGFEHGLAEQNPSRLWPDCKSVIVFAVAMSPTANNIYAGPRAYWETDRNTGPVPQNIQSCDFAMDRLSRLFVASISLRGIAFLYQYGYKVSFANLQAKICAFEAGLGVYGRSGIILHPELGNRMSIGTILTDAEMEPDDRLKDFEPCADCDLCIRKCPAQAYDPDKTYPDSWSRSKCVSKRAEIAGKGFYCHNCFAVCPAGRLDDKALLSIKESIDFHKPGRQKMLVNNVPEGAADCPATSITNT